MLLEEREVDQIIAFKNILVLREFDQYVIGIQIAVDEPGCDINGPSLAPVFRLARLDQGTGKNISTNEKACDVWLDPAGAL